MKFLVSNDDGIFSEGIIQLAKSLIPLGEVTVVAPDIERSASGHAITMHTPLRVKKVRLPGLDIDAYAVNGTPADCVKLGIDLLFDGKPDYVFTGINRGSNMGNDVLYSGTVSAAIEGCIMGVSAVALSLLYGDQMDYSLAGKTAYKIAQRLARETKDSDFLLNVNIPNIKEEQLRGTKITRLGNRHYTKNYEKRKDPRGATYYWLAGELTEESMDDNTDIGATANSYISITPLHYDLTCYKMVEKLKNLKLDLD